MANVKNTAGKTAKKSTTKVEKKIVKKEEPIEEKPIEEKENEEVTALKQQIEEMKKAMESLMSNKATEPSKVYVKEADNEVIIGCRMLQGVGWGDPNKDEGEIRLRFNEEQTVTVSDMKKFFRQASIRKLFEDGICYFANEEDYVLFNIRKYKDLSNGNLINILEKENINDVIRELDKITESKKNSSIVNCIVFRICDMIKNNELKWDYYTRKAIEDYFGVEFDRGILTLKALQDFKA